MQADTSTDQDQDTVTELRERSTERGGGDTNADTTESDQNPTRLVLTATQRKARVEARIYRGN